MTRRRPAESPDEMLSRVSLMAEGDEKWDLSPNDVAALKFVLGEHVPPKAKALLRDLAGALGRCSWDRQGQLSGGPAEQDVGRLLERVRSAVA